MNLSEYSAAAGAAVNQFIETFDSPKDPYARAALRFSPFFLLSPVSRGTGVDGFIRDPRVIGAAAVAGIVVLGENQNRSRRPCDIRIFAPETLAAGDRSGLVADVVDGRGAVVPNAAVSWSSSDEEVAAVAAGGDLVAVGVGASVISASSGGVVRRHLLTVTSS